MFLLTALCGNANANNKLNFFGMLRFIMRIHDTLPKKQQSASSSAQQQQQLATTRNTT